MRSEPGRRPRRCACESRIAALKRSGHLGLICPLCRSPLGSAKIGDDYRKCRGCGHTWSPSVSFTRVRRQEWPSVVAEERSSTEQRAADLETVYRLDLLPYNQTTLEAMRKKRRAVLRYRTLVQ